MNIADPNLLEIIAKHIDDKSTFNNFARSSKKCSQIVRKLTEVNKFEFKYINFISSKSAYIWDGCYTRGVINNKCVRVRFYPCGLEVVQDNEIEIKDYLDKFDKFDIFDFSNKYDYFLKDLCQVTEAYLSVIINGLESGGIGIFHFASDSHKALADLKDNYYEIKREIPVEKFIDSIKNEKLIIYAYDDEYDDEFYIFNIWIVRNLKAVIEELKKVEESYHKMSTCKIQ